MLKRGIFISLDGVEGCGKSTQATLLADYMRKLSYTVVLTREPGGTPIAEQIRGILLDPKNAKMTITTELLLYLASRAQHTSEIIIPALSDGKVVICERFSHATFVYQGYVRGFDLSILKQINKVATGGLEPDLTLILDIDPKIGFSRKSGTSPDRIEKEDIEFHNKVREGYIKIAHEDPLRMKIINAENSIQHVHLCIKGQVDQKLKDSGYI